MGQGIHVTIVHERAIPGNLLRCCPGNLGLEVVLNDVVE